MPSTETAHERGGELVPVKFSRLTRRGILLGLSLSQLITLGVGGASLVAAFYGGGGALFLITAPVWVLAAAITWIPVAGRPLVEWLPVTCWWLGAPPAGNWPTGAGSSPRPAGTSRCPVMRPGCVVRRSRDRGRNGA